MEAGETLEITDDKGQVFAVTGTEAPDTLAFVIAFDEWRTAMQLPSNPHQQFAWENLLEKFSRLPLRVQRQLPSFKSLGVKL